MQIRTQLLRDFFKRTNFIGPHHIIPICSCIRIYAGQIIRTNTAETAVFTSEEIPADADVVLDIAKLQAICATTNAEFLTITQDGTTTIVKETRARNTFGYENPQAYPAVPDTSDAAYCALSSEDISAITIASVFIAPDEAEGNHRFIHIGPGIIYGMRTFQFYFNATGHSLPATIVTKAEVDAISGIPNTEMAVTEKMNIYRNGAYTFSFLRSEEKSPAYQHVYDKISSQPATFSLVRSEIASFCDISLRTVDATGASSLTIMQGNDITCKHNALPEERSDVLSHEVPLFSFNHKHMAPIMRAVQGDVLQCFVMGKGGTNTHMGIRNEKETILFAGSVKNN